MATNETVADVLRDFDAMAAECGGLEAATIHAMTLRLSVANAREVEALRSDLSDYMQAADAEAARSDKLATKVEALQLALDNEQAKGVHTCSVHCERPLCVANRELDALRERAEAAETACADAAVVIRHAQLHECGRWPGLLKALDKCAAKSAAIGAGRADTRSGRGG